MTSSSSTTTPSKHAFETRVGDVKAPKSGINALILDYLTKEGYPEAAAKFSKEANLELQQEETSIKRRREIQHAIHVGDIETAITALNDLDPEILDMEPQLHFSLLRLQLVELIRRCNGGDISPALDFATTKLAPRAAMNNDFLKDLEKTMALLIFPHDSLQPEHAALLHSDLRSKTATEVNEAVLMRQAQGEAALRQLVKMRAWAESAARSKKKDLPERIELGLNGEDNDDYENGHEPMIIST